MTELEMMKEKMEKMKTYCMEKMEEANKEIASANSRATHTVRRNIKHTSDNLFLIKQSLEDIIPTHKVTMTQLQNLLQWATSAIETMKEAGVYSDPGTF